MKKKLLVVWDGKNRHPSTDQHKILWQNYNTYNKDIEFSMPQLLEDDADKFKAKYLELIYELGEVKISGRRIVDHLKVRENFSYWWMTLLVEKCNYSKSPQISNIIKLICLHDWLNSKNYSAIQFVSTNTALAKSMKLLADSLGIEFEWKKIEETKSKDILTRRIYNYLPHIFKAIIWLSYYLFDRWKLKGLGIEKWNNSIATHSFISYFFNLDESAINKGRYKSGYWSELPNFLNEENIQSNWLHIYVKSKNLATTHSAKKILKIFNKEYKEKQNHVFLDSFLSFGIVYKTVFGWIKIVKQHAKIKKVVEIHSNYLWPLIENDLKASLLGTTVVHNLLYYYLFLEASKMIPNQNKCVDLQENQGWEFGFISAWREFNHGDIIGMPHSTVRYWDLRYFFDSRSYNDKGALSLPLPSKVAINGDVEKHQYIRSGYPMNNLVEVEALRYLYLTQNNNKNISMKNRTVLVLADYLKEHTNIQMQLLVKASKNIKQDIKYIVKPHPAYPIMRDDYPDLAMEISHRPINELIDLCEIVYTSSVTSAAVDAYCFGKHVISVLDQATLNLSPLRGIKAGVSFVTTPEELEKILNNIDSAIDTDKQRVDYFYLNAELPRWKELLMSKELAGYRHHQDGIRK